MKTDHDTAIVAPAPRKQKQVEIANGIQDCVFAVPLNVAPLEINPITGRPRSNKPYDAEGTQAKRPSGSTVLVEIPVALTSAEERDFVRRTQEARRRR